MTNIKFDKIMGMFNIYYLDTEIQLKMLSQNLPEQYVEA